MKKISVFGVNDTKWDDSFRNAFCSNELDKRIAERIQRKINKRKAKLKGKKEMTLSDIMSIEFIARMTHEINRIYCESIGDYTQPIWENAKAWQIESSINGVKYVMKYPDCTPDFSHIEWLKEKKLTGWKWGEVKNVDKKEHPCIVPYEELPKEQKIKDHLFIGVVKMFIGEI